MPPHHRALIAIAALVFAAPASAVAEDMNDNVQSGPKNVPPVKCGYVTAMMVGCEGAIASALKRRGELQEATGQLIADGKCDEAMKLSLRQGDYGMAEKVRDMCATLYPAAPTNPQ